MRDQLNLLPIELIKKRKAAKRNLYLAAGFIVFMIFMTLIYFVLLIQVRFAETELSDVKEEKAIYESAISQYKLYEERQDEFTKLESKLADAKKGSINWSSILNKMTLLMPQQVFLTTLKGDEIGVSAEIYSTDFIGVAATLIQFNNIKEFSNRVSLNEVNKEKETGLLKFTVNAKFEVVPTSSAQQAVNQPQGGK